MKLSPLQCATLNYCGSRNLSNDTNYYSKTSARTSGIYSKKERISTLASSINEVLAPLAYGSNFQYMDDTQAENFALEKLEMLFANMTRDELKQVLSTRNDKNDPLFTLMFYGNTHRIEDFILSKIKTSKLHSEDTLELLRLKNSDGKNVLQHNIEYYYGSNVSINKILRLLKSLGMTSLKMTDLLTEKV